MKIQFAIAFIIIVSIYACSNDTDPVVEVDKFQDPLSGIQDKGYIRFDAPEVGQRNHYVRFKAIKAGNGTTSFSYLGDTLVMGIVGKTAAGWEVTLHLTRRSNLVVQNPLSEMADSIFTYQATMDSDSVKFKKQGLLYFSHLPLGRSALPLQLPAAAIEKADCGPELTVSVQKWYTHSYSCTVLGKEYESVIGYCDYSDMATDGFGFIYQYQMEHGFTRIAWISAWSSSEATGYDLVPRH